MWYGLLPDFSHAKFCLHPEADLRAMHVQLVFRLLESANPF